MMRILVTAGPTREFFDSVRFISNPSSGKMGFAIAEEAARRGHDVTLVAGPVDLPDPPGVRTIRVVSAAEMFDASIEAFNAADAAVMTAAVCDYRPTRTLPHKLKKQNRVRPIQLQPTADICAHLGKIKRDRVVIGFAMEDHNHHEHAEAKLRRKRCDAIILNGMANVGGDEATVEVLRFGGDWEAPVSGSKQRIAGLVLDLVADLLADPRRKSGSDS